MSFYNMVLLWALAGRNDVLIWLTGWSFRKLFTRTMLTVRKHEPISSLDGTCGNSPGDRTLGSLHVAFKS